MASYGSINAKTGAGNMNIPLTTIDLSDPFGEKEIFANKDFWVDVSFFDF